MENNDLRLIKLNSKDLEELVTLSIKTFSNAFEHQNTPENFNHYIKTALNNEKLKEELNNPNSEFYFAKLNNETVGYLKLNYNQAQSDLKEKNGMELERIYVLQGFQGINIGKKLLYFTINQAKQKKLDYVWLGVWDKNLRAIAFYKRNGFEISGSHPFYLGSDQQTDLIMKLNLKTHK